MTGFVVQGYKKPSNEPVKLKFFMINFSLLVKNYIHFCCSSFYFNSGSLNSNFISESCCSFPIQNLKGSYYALLQSLDFVLGVYSNMLSCSVVRKSDFFFHIIYIITIPLSTAWHKRLD